MAAAAAAEEDFLSSTLVVEANNATRWLFFLFGGCKRVVEVAAAGILLQ